MPQTIHAPRLTPSSEEAYRPYGGLIHPSLTTTPRIKTAAGHSFLEIVPTTSLYDEAPSRVKGRAVTNLAVVECQEGVVREYIKDGVEGTMGSGEKEEEKKKNKKRVVRIEKLERHRFTTQTFIPMGSGGAPGAGEGEAGKGKYLVVVSAARDEGPDPKGVKAWVADGGVGVCYAPGVWHAGMCVIDETMIFGQVQYMNGVNHEDVEFFQLDEPLEIVF